MTASIILGCSATLLIYFSHVKPRTADFVLLVMIANFFFIAAHCTIDNFSGDGLNDAAIAHLHHAIKAENWIRFWPISLSALVAFIIAALIYRFFSTLFRRPAATYTKLTRYACRVFAPVFIILSIFFNPLTYDLLKIYQEYRFNQLIELPAEYSTVSNVAPEMSYSAPNKHPNFVIILAESLEATFFNQENFPNLVNHTNELIKSKGFRIHGIRDLQLSNWTDSALVATMCGTSLTVNYSDEHKQAHTSLISERMTSSKVIGETCIGDILLEQDYDLSFIGGSEFGWGSKSKLFRSQGYRTIIGPSDIEKRTGKKLPKSTWGLYDEELFNFAENFLKNSKSSQDRPTGITLLTLDTHLPGYPSPNCRKKYGNAKDPLLNAVHCIDEPLSRFINSAISASKLKDTVVFLLSDHVYPGTLPRGNLPHPARENLFVVFNSRLETNALPSPYKRIASSLDVAPTILAHLGYDIPTVNMGRNLMSSNPTLPEAMGYPTFSANIVTLRRSIQSHWKTNIQQDIETTAHKN